MEVLTMDKTRYTNQPGSTAGGMTSAPPDPAGGARMNAPAHRVSLAAETVARRPRVARLDWAVAVASGSLVGGFWLDGWAHHAFPQLETFFTPWHAALYSGFLALATVLLGALAAGRLRGRSWRRAAPAGYGASVLGVLVFLAGGVGDMLWHELFGIEVDLAALLSPTHLLLALGGVLMVGGPLRAAWRRPEAGGTWAALLPALLSLT